jgi:hypothetical protein
MTTLLRQSERPKAIFIVLLCICGKHRARNPISRENLHGVYVPFFPFAGLPAPDQLASPTSASAKSNPKQIFRRSTTVMTTTATLPASGFYSGAGIVM